jgi:hypothetical protein
MFMIILDAALLLLGTVLFEVATLFCQQWLDIDLHNHIVNDFLKNIMGNLRVVDKIGMKHSSNSHSIDACQKHDEDASEDIKRYVSHNSQQCLRNKRQKGMNSLVCFYYVITISPGHRNECTLMLESTNGLIY